MKTKNHYLVWLLPFMLLTACQIDNYDAPKSKLEGQIVYQQDPINVSYNNVTFELWQSGFGKMTPINVTVDQDGSYSAVLFDGDYKLIIPKGQGPFMRKVNTETQSDTVLVHVTGDQTMNIEVEPYYMVRDPQFSVADSKVSANCKLEQIVTDSNAKNVENVSLYISKTKFVDSRTSISSQTIDGTNISDLSNISLNADIPQMTPTQNYVFVRIGVKIKDVEDKIYSPVTKLEF